MVTLTDVRASNAQIPTSLPSKFVAVFAGATSGIGETTLKTLVKYVVEPRIYLLARNPTSAARVIATCRQTNPRGEYIFIKVDLSSVKETDIACKEVKSKEENVNLVFLSAGEVRFDRIPTPEGLNIFLAALIYTRLRIIQQLLPQLTHAASSGSLARVVNVAGATNEGNIDTSDIAAFKIPLTQLKPHLSSMHTLALETLAQQAPSVSFVHDYPGAVYTDLHKDPADVWSVLHMVVITILHMVLRGLFFIPIEESGERHVFLATNSRYAASEGSPVGTELNHKDGIAIGSGGEKGSGVYSVGWDGEGPNEKARVALEDLRRKGVQELVWEHFVGEFHRVCGTT